MLGAGLTCTTTATPTSSVGSYPSSCSGATDGNYSISYVAGRSSSHRRHCHHGLVQQDDLRRSRPGHHAHRVGLQNGETPSVLGANLLCTTGADSSSPVGDYARACEGAVDANYTFTYSPGDLTLNPATLKITASSGTVAYGSLRLHHGGILGPGRG